MGEGHGDLTEREREMLAVIVAIDEILGDAFRARGRHEWRVAVFKAVEWTRGVHCPAWLRERVIAEVWPGEVIPDGD